MKLVDYRMEIENYKLSRLMFRSSIRHITLENQISYDRKIESLCKLYTLFYQVFSLHIGSNTYPDLYKDLCKKCFKKLPIKIQTEIKFRYMVYKLKNENED